MVEAMVGYKVRLSNGSFGLSEQCAAGRELRLQQV